MTDQERQKLVANLYSLSRGDDRAILCYDAADEIERLAERLQYQYACNKARQREIERLTAEAKGRRPIYAEALLREARPYVASAKGVNFVDSLLRDIDGVLAQSGKAQSSAKSSGSRT
jgi:DNA repair exonuclease SbcCD ATPase subunit